MPELPEVETVKNGIAGFIGNAKILAVHINNDNLREKIPEDITEKINGANILSYRRIGKYIVIDLNNKLSLIWHLGMSGKIKTFADLPSQKEKHDHIVIETNQTLSINNIIINNLLISTNFLIFFNIIVFLFNIFVALVLIKLISLITD